MKQLKYHFAPYCRDKENIIPLLTTHFMSFKRDWEFGHLRIIYNLEPHIKKASGPSRRDLKDYFLNFGTRRKHWKDRFYETLAYIFS